MKKTAKKPKIKFDSRLPDTRCTSAELATIKAKAAQAGLTPSAYMRRMGVHGKIAIKESKTDTQLIRHIAAIGNNLNQYQKRVNLGGLTPYEHDLLIGCLEKIDTVLTGLLNDTTD
ncbi:plasmid mobilization protein [Aquimarina longa]|uniref:plasmid mobilization protein n=1 Tax=Aquimarina longa TaxID=1080221 RepID=UPI000B0A2F0D|nr:hypothetical protein [Aquimarina longa]